MSDDAAPTAPTSRRHRARVDAARRLLGDEAAGVLEEAEALRREALDLLDATEREVASMRDKAAVHLQTALEAVDRIWDEEISRQAVRDGKGDRVPAACTKGRRSVFHQAADSPTADDADDAPEEADGRVLELASGTGGA